MGLTSVSKITAAEMGMDKLNIQVALHSLNEGDAIPIATIVGKVASIEVGMTANGECSRVRGSFRASPDGVEYFSSSTLFPPAIVADALVAQAVELGIEGVAVDPDTSDEKRFKVFKRYDATEAMVLQVQIEAVKTAKAATGYRFRAIALQEETAESDPLLALLKERCQPLLGAGKVEPETETQPEAETESETPKKSSKKATK